VAQQHSSLSLVSPGTPNKSVRENIQQSNEIFRLLVDSVQEYAIFLLDREGKIMTWNLGAEKIKGYKGEEIIGQHFSRFYTQEARESGWPERELEFAVKEGRFTDEGWRVRKDGSTFWAYVVITALRGKDNELLGFSKVTCDLTDRRALEERTQELNRELRGRLSELAASQRQGELRSLALKKLSAQLLRVQDEERRRLARELHDDLGQLLVATKLILGNSVQQQSNAEAVKLIDQAQARVRNLSHLLHPPLLDESGLQAALHWYVDGLRKRSNIRVSLECRPIPFQRLSREIETAIFRIVQESLTNVYRHSGSDAARIEVQQQPDQVLVRIRDFGKGIDVDGVFASGFVGLGINGMRERVSQLGGQVRVSRAEPGTLIEATIPLFPSEPQSPV
jgi:PAS domain S-box-containing protein